MSSRVRANHGGGIQVIARAGQILRTLATTRDGLSLSEVAQRVELPKSTVHRIIGALETEGLVAAAPPNGRYKLGPEVLRLASGQGAELRAELRPLLRRLSAEVNETVDLSVLIHERVSFIDQVAAPHRLRAVSAVGASFPAHCTANGKALLAAHRDETLRKLLPAKLEAATPNTITDREVLIEQLAIVRRIGYAEDREELTLGISAVGAVISDGLGPVAAVSVPVPTQRFTGNESSLAGSLVSAAAEMSEILRLRRA
ncbi:MAG: IclR family transcriptional regulator [Candidatus Woesearchaeota archaeon]